MIFLILLIAAILRFWQLASVPPALDWDEVSNAYNGYAIWQTGKDEFGQKFPILFRAYDGFVPGLLIYLNALGTAVFGLNELGARFPNAFLGVAAVGGIYLLVKRLFLLQAGPVGRIGTMNHEKSGTRIALLSALFLAISPWHITYSRVDVLPILPVVLVVFGTYFFLKVQPVILSSAVGQRRTKDLSSLRFFAMLRMRVSRFAGTLWLISSSISFTLAVFSYFSAYVFVPLFSILLILIYRQKINLRQKVLFLLPVISAVILVFSLPGGQNRMKGVSVFSDPDLVKTASQEAVGEGFMGRILHNRRVIYAQKFLEGYVSYFHLDFLFAKGDAVERMVVPGPGFGLMYFWDLPFFLAGVYFLIRKRPRFWPLIIGWLLLAPAAAAVSLPQPASTRTTLMIPALVVITAYGFWSLTQKWSRVVKMAVLIFLILNFFIFSHQYFFHFPIEKSKDWFYGYRQLFDYLSLDENRNRQIYFVFGQPDFLDQIHMFTLFYNKVDPELYQAAGGTKLACIGTTGRFSFQHYHFVPFGCGAQSSRMSDIGDGLPARRQGLVVMSKNMGVLPRQTIYLLNGESILYVYGP